MLLDTISNSKLCPLILFEKSINGVSKVAVLGSILCNGIESIVADLMGFPNFSFSPKPAFKTFINCSYQFAFPDDHSKDTV